MIQNFPPLLGYSAPLSSDESTAVQGLAGLGSVSYTLPDVEVQELGWCLLGGHTRVGRQMGKKAGGTMGRRWADPHLVLPPPQGVQHYEHLHSLQR